MQSKKARKTRPKTKPKRKRRKQPSPADPKNRLKPISLHGMELEDVLRRLMKPRQQPP